MSGQSRDDALHRLEEILEELEDELLEMAASLTEQDLGHFISEVSSLCRDAWDCRLESDDELEEWEYWPVMGMDGW